MDSSHSADDSESAKEHGPILGHYVNVARILSEMFAPVLEAVVHDLRIPEHSIVAIFNGHITNRKIGDPATDVCRRLIDGDFPDRLVGYENESPNGQKLKSSSLAIRNEAGELIGVMGLNMDVSYFEQFGKFIDHFITRQQSEHVRSGEKFRGAIPDGRTTPREDIQSAIDRFITSRSWNARMLSNKEKREIVGHLFHNGYFKARGAVTIIAEELGLTRASIYNYKNDYVERRDGAEA